MEYQELKNCLLGCPDIHGLDEEAQAFLLLRGEEVALNLGDSLYDEGAPLDNTCCILLSGGLDVEKGGDIICQISRNQLFGEVAYFTTWKVRTATVRSSSKRAVVLRIRLSEEELGAPRFAALKKHLGLRAWTMSVSDSQLNP